MADSIIPLPPSTTKKSNKIRDIVRLQQMLKKWKKAAIATKNNNNNNNDVLDNVAPPTNKTATAAKGLNKFLKKTLSFSDISNNNSSSSLSSSGGQADHQEGVAVRKGYLAVWVGREEDAMKKFVIPTDYLAHQAFSVLLRDAEEEFGFQQEGILKIPCDVPLFENILKLMTHDSSNNKKNHQQQQQRPTTLLKSSSSTSSFFLYEQQQQPQPELLIINHPATTRSSTTTSTTFDSQLKTPPTTPTRHLPLYCR